MLVSRLEHLGAARLPKFPCYPGASDRLKQRGYCAAMPASSPYVEVAHAFVETHRDRHGQVNSRAVRFA